MKVKVHVFWLGHFARSKIKSESSFLIKYYKTTIQKKIMFWPILKKVKKMDLPLYFQILCGRVQGGFFKLGRHFFLQNGWYLPPKQPWGPQCLDFVIITYSYPLLKNRSK